MAQSAGTSKGRRISSTDVARPLQHYFDKQTTIESLDVRISWESTTEISPANRMFARNNEPVREWETLYYYGQLTITRNGRYPFYNILFIYSMWAMRIETHKAGFVRRLCVGELGLYCVGQQWAAIFGIDIFGNVTSPNRASDEKCQMRQAPSSDWASNSSAQ